MKEWTHPFTVPKLWTTPYVLYASRFYEISYLRLRADGGLYAYAP